MHVLYSHFRSIGEKTTMSKRILFSILILAIVSGYGYKSYKAKDLIKTKECLAMIYNAQKNYKVENQKYADSLKLLTLQFPRSCKGLDLSISSGPFQFSVTAKNSISGEWETNHRKQVIKRF